MLRLPTSARRMARHGIRIFHFLLSTLLPEFDPNVPNGYLQCRKREMSLFLLQTFELSDEVCIPWISRVTSSDADVFLSMLVLSRRSLVAQPCPSRPVAPVGPTPASHLSTRTSSLTTPPSHETQRLTNRLALDRGREFVGVLHKGLRIRTILSWYDFLRNCYSDV